MCAFISVEQVMRTFRLIYILPTTMGDFICEVCGKTFQTDGWLIGHLSKSNECYVSLCSRENKDMNESFQRNPIPEEPHSGECRERDLHAIIQSTLHLELSPSDERVTDIMRELDLLSPSSMSLTLAQDVDEGPGIGSDSDHFLLRLRVIRLPRTMLKMKKVIIRLTWM